MMDPRIWRSIDAAGAVPAAPQVVTRLLEVTRGADFDRREVLKLLSSDAGMLSDLLKLANSALYRAVVRIENLEQALTRLGIRRIRKLVIARSLIGGLRDREIAEFDSSYFWRRSLGTAVIAAQMSDAAGGGERDHAFLAGLLCDVGVPILARAMPREYAELLDAYAPLRGDDLFAREQQTLGTSHAEVSAAALERWSLPQELLLAVRYHHDAQPPQSLGESAQLALLLNAADELSRMLCEAPDRAQIRGLCASVAAKAGLDLASFPTILERVEPEVAELAALFKVEIIPSKVYALIARTIAGELAGAPG